MCVQFVVQSLVQYSRELYKSQVQKKIKELAKKIHFKVYPSLACACSEVFCGITAFVWNK